MSPKHTLTVLALAAIASAALAGSAPRNEKVLRCYENSYDSEVQGDYTGAMNALARLHKAFPRDYTVNMRLGRLRNVVGDYKMSEKHYRTAIKAEPSAIEGKIGYMLPLLARKEYSLVEALARQVLTVDAANYYANLRLAIALRLQGKYDSAENVIESMLKLYPADVSFLTELGLNATAQGDTNAAKRAFFDVLVLSPEHATAKDQLAKL